MYVPLLNCIERCVALFADTHNVTYSITRSYHVFIVFFENLINFLFVIFPYGLLVKVLLV